MFFIRLFSCIIISGMVTGILAARVYAASASSAVVVSLVGDVWAERAGGTRVALSVGDAVQKNDTIITGAGARAQVLFPDNTTLAISEKARLEIAEFSYQEKNKKPVFKADVSRGVARFITGKVVEQNRDGFSVETPQATVGIRGTTFAVEVSPEGVTAVSGMDVSSSLPIDVRNASTGSVSQIKTAGQGVQISAIGNGSYQFSGISAPPIDGGHRMSPAAGGDDVVLLDASPTGLAGASTLDKGPVISIASILPRENGPSVSLPGETIPGGTNPPETPLPSEPPGQRTATYTGELRISPTESGSFSFDVRLSSGAISNGSMSATISNVGFFEAVNGVGRIQNGAGGGSIRDFDVINFGGAFNASSQPEMKDLIVEGDGTTGTWSANTTGSYRYDGTFSGAKR